LRLAVAMLFWGTSKCAGRAGLRDCRRLRFAMPLHFAMQARFYLLRSMLLVVAKRFIDRNKSVNGW
jgi:hypothetical protein